MDSRHDLNGNNVQTPPEPDDKQHESSDDEILRRAGWLRGFRVDGVDEPRISAHKVASCKDGATPVIEDSDTSNLWTGLTTSKNEREVNYSHRGWLLSATRTTSPWISSRIATNNQKNPAGTWYTRITKAKRMRIEVSIEDLMPKPEFEMAVEEALAHQTTFEKFQAVYHVLNCWGDVLPLDLEIGSSIILSTAYWSYLQSPEIDGRKFGNICQFLTIRDMDVAMTGADPNLTYDQWATVDDTASKSRWQRIMVNKVVPTINLLSGHLQARLSELYAQRLCYAPSGGIGPINQSHQTYDDYIHASKTISSIKIRCSLYFIELISIAYSDGISSTKHGGSGNAGTEYEFTLFTGEYVTEVLRWMRGEYLYGLQFVTNMGRCSNQYGIHYGAPTVARCKGGVLGIWRRDLVPRVPKEDDVYSDYFGDTDQNGQAFNDRVFLGNSASIRISSVEVWSGEWIDGIRINYVDFVDGCECRSSTTRRGGLGSPSASYHQFMLEDGEHIVTVSGRNETSCITQLCLVTNRGRTSEVFGGGKGQPFSALAPQDKDGKYFRLQYICGKSNEAALTGVMFIWTPC